MSECETCEDCDGAGYHGFRLGRSEPCDACGGEGKVERDSVYPAATH